MPDPQQPQGDVVIVDDAGTPYHFPPGMDVRHAIAIVRNHGNSSLPTKPVSAEDFTGTNLPLITGTTNAQELRTIGQEIGPENAKRVREMQSYGEDAGIGLGAAALTGGTSALGNAAVKAAIPGLLYQGGTALGAPPWLLNTLLAGSSVGAIPSIARVFRGAPMPETPAPQGLPKGTETNAQLDALARVRAGAPPARIMGPPPREALINEMLDALQKPEPPQGVELPPPAELPPGYTPRSTTPTQAPRIVSMKPPPLSPNTRSSWPSGEPPVPQQTSSIQPTENAYVNVDKPQPLPSDNPSGWHSGAEDAVTKQNMRGAHIDIKHDDANYQGAVADLKATVGPDFLKALLDSLNRGGR
jgi:hypothetical protein